MIELDHVFIFVSPGAPEAEALIELGFDEGAGNVHPGQGTANRRFFFDRTFLELLWVHDEDEVRSALIAPTFLWERSRSVETGYSPFGLCVRPQDPRQTDGDQIVLAQTWAYLPPYLPDGMSIAVADNRSNAREPMLFQIAGGPMPDSKMPAQDTEVRHPLGVRKITKVILQTPVWQEPSAAMARLLETDWMFHEFNQETHLILEFDHCGQQQVADLSPQLPLTVKW